ncbi:mitogen-activated protein kinase kinase kinase 1-like [Malania oleifera]|uniref:mitogen-activated protein kinase kinase kinase 1-like n=1 Tax=Malania oleifera TaxID=397392 RepID=UPI0025AE932F|nr:mitogen-activated protein kinase kinase kinase 1-like [Malania oleifera]
MHLLPRILVHSKQSRSMDSKQKGRKPKLERRNAAKNIDYDASSSSSSLDEASSLRTRSLDLTSLGDRRSFRVEGTDGDFDRICHSLGLSAEDFAIPQAAWEAMRIRSSSDVLPRSRLHQLESAESQEREIESLEMQDRVVLCDLPARVQDSVRVNDACETRNDSLELNGYSSNVGPAGSGGGGIKGARPPLLAPPPVMLLPVCDNGCSTWDILRSFAPESDRGSSITEPDAFGSDDEVGRVTDQREEAGGMRLGETAILSESCSFTTSNDDDCSSTTTEPMSNISPNGRFSHNIKGWQKGGLLGRGSFGSVYEGITDDGFFFAVKEVSLLDQGSQGKQSVYQLEQEISLLSRFEHENIVRYLGTDKDDSNLYIFLELVTKGSLQDVYQRFNLWDSLVSAYTRQILHGLKYLHDQNVVHRDIKCANILVDASGSVKLADFGLAKATKLNDVKSCKGTAFWMAPEVVNRKNQGYGLAADIWSLGCTVLEMATSQIPYSHLESMQALFRIGKGVPPPVPDYLTRDCRDFILQCLQVNPDHRPTAAQLLDHAFVKRSPLASSDSASPLNIGRRV